MTQVFGFADHVAPWCRGGDGVETRRGVHFDHDRQPYTADRDHPYEITATITSMDEGGIVGDSPALHYRVNGDDFTAVPMLATGNPDEYGATIPPQPWGTTIDSRLWCHSRPSQSPCASSW